MSANLFILSWSHWEDYVPYFFMGPSELSQEDFQSLCEQVAKQAALAAIADSSNSGDKGFIGWDEIVRAMIPLLAESGFINFIPKEAKFRGSGSILRADDGVKLGPIMDLISYHNGEVSHNMHLIHLDDEE